MLTVRCETVIQAGGCLRRRRHCVWRWKKKRVRFASEETTASNGGVRRALVPMRARANTLVCAVKFPCLDPAAGAVLADDPELHRLPKFDPRCLGLANMSLVASLLFPQLPKLIVVTRVWREVPASPHQVTFALAAPLRRLLQERASDPARFRWLLLLLNRLLMSEPQFRTERVLATASRGVASLFLSRRRLPPARSAGFFVFTPVLWQPEEEFQSASDAAVQQFVLTTAHMFEPMDRETLAEKDTLSSPKLGSSVTTAVSETDIETPFALAAPYLEAPPSLQATSASPRVRLPAPAFLITASGVEVSSVKEFSRLLICMKELWPGSVTLGLVLDELIDVLAGC